MPFSELPNENSIKQHNISFLKHLRGHCPTQRSSSNNQGTCEYHTFFHFQFWGHSNRVESQNGKHPNLQTFNGFVVSFTLESFACGYGSLSKRKMSMFCISTTTLSNSTMTYTLAPTCEQRLKASLWTKKVRASSTEGWFNRKNSTCGKSSMGRVSIKVVIFKKMYNFLQPHPKDLIGEYISSVWVSNGFLDWDPKTHDYLKEFVHNISFDTKFVWAALVSFATTFDYRFGSTKSYSFKVLRTTTIVNIFLKGTYWQASITPLDFLQGEKVTNVHMYVSMYSTVRYFVALV